MSWVELSHIQKQNQYLGPAKLGGRDMELNNLKSRIMYKVLRGKIKIKNKVGTER